MEPLISLLCYCSRAFHNRPYIFSVWWGFLSSALAAIIGIYLFINHILYLTTEGMGEMLNMRPLLVISFSLMIVGLQIFLIALLSELVLRVSASRYYKIKEEI